MNPPPPARLARDASRRAILLRWVSVFLLISAVGAAATAPASPTAANLKRLSLEELLAMDVTSVSRRPEPFATAATAISVLTDEDIRRFGATNLADALRFSTGLEVARIDGRTWGVASRGFNINSSNKLLVMLDGRSLYTPLFAGAFWDVQDTELTDLDRIEVVRGPGATMWGANAVNGVISIQTKNARDTQGTLVTAGGGNEERQFASFRHGLKLADGIYARVYAKEYARDDLVFPDGADARDDARMWQGGFRADGEPTGAPGVWTLQGDYYHGFLGAASVAPSRVAGGNILGRWRQALSPLHTWSAQAYYDRVERFVPGQFRETRDSFDFDTQFDAAIGSRHQLVLGLVARSSLDHTGTAGTARFSPPDRRMTVVSALVQDEVSLVDDRLGLTFGAKLEENNSTGFEVQPSVRAAWHPNKDHTVWAAISRALRTPTRFDDDLRFVLPTGMTFIRGDPAFRAEEVIAYELGYRVHPRSGWSFDLSLFANRYDHLRSQELAGEPGVLFVLRNQLNAETHGGELAVTAQLTARWRVRTMYSYLHKRLQFDAGSTDPTGGMQEGNDPRHMATLVSSWDLPRRWEFDAMVRHVGSLPAPFVPHYTQLDLRLGWRPVMAWELAVVGQNLLDPHHREFGAPAGPTARELQRSVYAKVTWRF